MAKDQFLGGSGKLWQTSDWEILVIEIGIIAKDIISLQGGGMSVCAGLWEKGAW